MGARGSKSREAEKPLLSDVVTETQASSAPAKASPDKELVSISVQAAFHSYEEGHEKPYLTYMRSPLRSTPLNLEFSQGQLMSSGAGAPEGAEDDVRMQNGPPPGWEVVAFVNCAKTDTQLWLYCRPERKQVMVAFRGTSVKQGFSKDMWTDLNFRRKAWTDLHDEEHGQGGAGGGKCRPRIQVHTGFHDAYTSSVGDNHLLFRLIDELIAEKEAPAGGKPAAAPTSLTLTAASGTTADSTTTTTTSKPLVTATAEGACDGDGASGAGWHVILTGHSLGGALATLAAYELAKEKSAHGRLYGISLYTYGAPRVGNEAFALDFDARVPDAWRMVNPKDVVPRVPPVTARYCHCGTHCRVTKGAVEVVPHEKSVGWFRRVLRNTASLFRSLLGSWLVFRVTKWHGIYREYLADTAAFAVARAAAA